jgi:hypothetical protein
VRCGGGGEPEERVGAHRERVSLSLSLSTSTRFCEDGFAPAAFRRAAAFRFWGLHELGLLFYRSLADTDTTICTTVMFRFSAAVLLAAPHVSESAMAVGIPQGISRLYLSPM